MKPTLSIVGEELLVREAMVKNPVTIGPNATVIEAVRLLRDKNIGSVIMVDKDKVLGIAIERDLVRRVLAEDRDPKAVKLRDVMSRSVISIEAGNDVVDAAQLMKQKGISRLVVMEGDKLVGIITSDDLASNMKHAVEELATTLLIMESERT